MKLTRIMAWIGLAHIAVFSVAFIMYLIDSQLFKGLNYLVAYSGIMGFLIYLYVLLAKREASSKEDESNKEQGDK